MALTSPRLAKTGTGAGDLRGLAVWAVLGLWLLPLTAAHAFSDPVVFGKFPGDSESADQVLGGGGGRFFTGSPADGYDCTVCHTSREAFSFPLYQTGLPVGGYIPGQKYTSIKLQWPEAAQKVADAQATGLDPRLVLMAEFVSENGESSGSIELAPDLAKAPEFCAPKVTDTDGPPLAARIYRASRIAETREVTIKDKHLPCSTAGDGDPRCILAIPSCGASALTVRWTAPTDLKGPVWFSAAMVVTYNADGVPTFRDYSDYTTVLTVPMNLVADGPTYETQLDGGCSVLGLGRTQRSRLAQPWLLAFAVVFWALVKRRRRVAAISSNGLALAAAAALCVWGSACDDHGGLGYSATDDVGRYEPVSQPDSGPKMCMSVDIPAPAQGAPPAPGGMLTVQFQMIPPLGVMHGNWDDKNPAYPNAWLNCGVVWIEDSMGRFVKTLEEWNASVFCSTSLSVYVFEKRLYCDVDVMSTPTQMTYAPHTSMWNGQDTKGNVVPDGTYKLWIDVQIDEAHPMAVYSVPIEKGRMMWVMQPPSVPPHSGLTLTYQPQ